MDTITNLWNASEIHSEINKFSPSFWSNALGGEAGEFGNLIKKLDRGDEWDEEEAMEEHADIFIYWVLMAKRLGWTLDNVIESIIIKQAEVKVRYEEKMRIDE